MAGRQAAVGDHRLDRLRQGQQAQQVRHMAAAAADRFRQGFLGMGEFVHQALICLRLLDRVEILTLQVLDQRDFERILVAQLADQHRHFVQLRTLRRPPATLARNYLVAVRSISLAPYDNRLQDAFLTNRIGQRCEVGLVEMSARLEPARCQVLDRNETGNKRLVEAGLILAFIAEQRRKSAPEAPPRIFAHHAASGAGKRCSRRSTSPASRI